MNNWDEKLPRDMGFLCPITGSRLMYTGHEEHVMDGLSFYAAESDPKAIRYSRHPFAYNLFYTLSSGEFERIFRLNDDRTWTEMIYVFGKLLFPIDTPNDVIAKELREYEEKEAARLAEYERKVASGEITPGPKLQRVVAQTNGLDLVKVKPISPPNCILNFIDFKYGNDDVTAH